MNYSERLNHVIPGGCHTYSRGDDQYPENAPQIFERGEGAYLYSPDGKKLLDYGMALRAVTLGYANKEVNEAAIEGMMKGNNLTRASVIELEAAEKLAEIIPSVDMVKFAKNGSNVTTAATKIARAYTGRKYLLWRFVGFAVADICTTREYDQSRFTEPLYVPCRCDCNGLSAMSGNVCALL